MELLTGKKIQQWVINSIYIKANIGKYLPGNVFHFAGRNLLGKQYNLDQKALLGSTLLLHAQTITLSLIFPFILNIKIYGEIIKFLKEILGQTYLLVVCGLIIAIIFLFICFHKQIEIHIREIFRNFTNKSPGRIVGNLFFTGIYLILYGTSFLLITFAISGIGWSINTTIVIIVSFILAWLCGLVIIGSPGGIGVREIVLLFLLRNMIPEAELLIIVIVHRFCTVCADVLSFGLEILKEKLFMGINGQ